MSAIDISSYKDKYLAKYLEDRKKPNRPIGSVSNAKQCPYCRDLGRAGQVTKLGYLGSDQYIFCDVIQCNYKERFQVQQSRAPIDTSVTTGNIELTDPLDMGGHVQREPQMICVTKSNSTPARDHIDVLRGKKKARGKLDADIVLSPYSTHIVDDAEYHYVSESGWTRVS